MTVVIMVKPEDITGIGTANVYDEGTGLYKYEVPDRQGQDIIRFLNSKGSPFTVSQDGFPAVSYNGAKF